MNGPKEPKDIPKPEPAPPGSRRGVPLMGLTALVLITLFVGILFREALFGDRVMLSFDTRLWPPFSGYAYPGLGDAPSNGIHSDLPCWMVPERLVTASLLEKGISPLWTPYTLGGQPLLAGLAYPAYYPVNLILHRVLEVDPVKALAWQTLFHLVLAGMGMYAFLRILRVTPWASLLGGLTLPGSAWYLTHAYIPLFVNSAAWLPWMLLAAERLVRGHDDQDRDVGSLNAWRRAFGGRTFGGWAIALTLFTGMSFLGGFPQTTFSCLYGTGLWIACRSLFGRDHGRRGFARLAPLAALGLTAGLGLGLAGIQMGPAAEFKKLSMRDRDYPLEYYHDNALQPESLIEQVAPGFFGHPVDPELGGSIHGALGEFLPYRAFMKRNVQNNFMENALFVGTIPFLLALAALVAPARRSRWILLLMSLVPLGLALGTPLLDLAYHGLPGFRVGSPKRILLLHTFAVTALAALGLDRFIRAERPGKVFSLVLLTLGATGGVALLLGFPGSWIEGRAKALEIPLHGGNPADFEALITRLRILCLVPVIHCLVLGFAGLLCRLPRVPPFFAFVVIVLTLAELLGFGLGFVTTQPAEGQYPETETCAFLTERAAKDGPFRAAAFGPKELLMPNLAAVHGVESVGGVSGLILERYGRYVEALDPKLIDMEDPRFVGSLNTPERLDSPLLDLLGVRYLAVSQESLGQTLMEKGFTLAFRKDAEGIGLLENPEVFPRAFLVTEFEIAEGDTEDGNREAALARVRMKDFDPARRVILEKAPPPGFFTTPSRSSAAPEGEATGDPVTPTGMRNGFGTGAVPGPKTRPRPAEILDYGPLEIRIRTSLDEGPGFLVLADAFHPGWTAEVDGAPAEVLAANYAFRAVPVARGTHEVVFRFTPKSFLVGRASTGAAMLLLLVWTGWLLLRRSRKPDTTP